MSLPGLPKHLHERFFWILTVRETSFAGGAMVLAGSVWPRNEWAGTALVRTGRWIVALTMAFYAVEHFVFPLFVPGVPLENPMPDWVAAPRVLSYLVGVSLLAGGIGLAIPKRVRVAAAACGTVLLLLTAFFYVPIFVMEMQTPGRRGGAELRGGHHAVRGYSDAGGVWARNGVPEEWPRRE